jgi:hypothetical protein
MRGSPNSRILSDDAAAQPPRSCNIPVTSTPPANLIEQGLPNDSSSADTS